jgi:hypothetical protein
MTGEAERKAISDACSHVWSKCLRDPGQEETEALRLILCTPFVLLLLLGQRREQALKALSARSHSCKLKLQNCELKLAIRKNKSATPCTGLC